MPSGVFSLKLVNRLPFDITACRLVIGVTHTPAEQDDANQTPAGQAVPIDVLRLRGGSRQAAKSTVDSLIDVYHMNELQILSAGATYEEAIEADFQVLRNIGTMVSWRNGSLRYPRLMGTLI